MSFYYLLLGHLFGDFVLQTDIIAGNKGRHSGWNALHAFLVTLCIFLMSIPFGTVMLVLALANGAAHYFMDLYKPKFIKLLKLPDLAGFLADQLIHILILYLISLTAATPPTGLFQPDFQVVRLLLVIVLVTSFAAILNQYVLETFYPRNDGAFFARWEKHAGIIIRLYTSFVIYISISSSPFFLLLLLPAAAALILVHERVWSSWMKTGQLVFKFILDLAASAAGAGLLLWM